MNEHVVQVLKEQIWYLGTYADEPNAVRLQIISKK